MGIKHLSEYNLICIEDFCGVSSQERILINNSIEKNLSIFLSEGGEFKSQGNFPLYEDDTLFFSNLYDRYKELCYKLFGNFHIDSQNSTTCWCYRSNVNNSLHDVWHNHLYTSTINGVYYYQVEGDGIFFERHGKEFNYVPQQGELLIFPNDLNHTPQRSTSQTWRYSINMEIKTEESASTLFKNYGFS